MTTQRKSSKKHTCALCGKVIPANRRYHEISVKNANGEYTTKRYHRQCNKI